MKKFLVLLAGLMIQTSFAANQLRYGDWVKLRHANTGNKLTGRTDVTPKQPISNQDFVVATAVGDFWRVRGAHGAPEPALGTEVKLNDVIRFERVPFGTGEPQNYFLHSYADVKNKSVVTGQGQVTIVPNGNPDSNWKIIEAEGGKIGIFNKLKIQHVNTGQVLHSHPNKYPANTPHSGLANVQEVTTFPGRDTNDYFVIELLRRGDNAPAMAQLQNGVKVAIKSLRAETAGKFLRVDNNRLRATGTDLNDPACQFTLLRYKNYVGLKSAAAGNNNLQMDINTADAVFANQNFSGSNDQEGEAGWWEQWMVDFEDPNSLANVRLISKSRPGYLCIHENKPADWHKGFAQGNWAAGSISGRGPWELIELVIIENAPAEAVQTPGATMNVAVGSANGQMKTVCLASNKSCLWVFDEKVDTRWVRLDPVDGMGQPIAPEYVSVSSEGDVLLIGQNGKAYLQENGQTAFKILAGVGAGNDDTDFDSGTIGNDGNIWAIDDNVLFQWQNRTWVLQEFGITDVSAGIDGTVYAISSNRELLRLNRASSKVDDLTWDIVIPDRVISVSCGSKNQVMVVLEDGTLGKIVDDKLVVINGKDGQETYGFDSISVNAAGSYFATTPRLAIYQAGNAGVKIETAPATASAPEAPVVAAVVPSTVTPVAQVAATSEKALQATGPKPTKAVESKRKKKQNNKNKKEKKSHANKKKSAPKIGKKAKGAPRKKAAKKVAGNQKKAHQKVAKNAVKKAAKKK